MVSVLLGEDRVVLEAQGLEIGTEHFEREFPPHTPICTIQRNKEGTPPRRNTVAVGAPWQAVPRRCSYGLAFAAEATASRLTKAQPAKKTRFASDARRISLPRQPSDVL